MGKKRRNFAINFHFFGRYFVRIKTFPTRIDRKKSSSAFIDPFMLNLSPTRIAILIAFSLALFDESETLCKQFFYDRLEIEIQVSKPFSSTHALKHNQWNSKFN